MTETCRYCGRQGGDEFTGGPDDMLAVVLSVGLSRWFRFLRDQDEGE